MGYVHARVTDLAQARAHYVDTLGLSPTLEEPGRIFCKGWDEWDHHSVVLEEGGVGAIKFGFKVRDSADLDRYEEAARTFGVSVQRMSAGDNPEVGDGLRIALPNGHTIELYHEMTVLGVEVGTQNPQSFPRHLVGVGAPCLDHALLMGEDVESTERFFTEVLGFYVTEQLVASDDDPSLIATWLSTGNKTHDVALIKGPDGKLHHFAFYLKNWNEVQRAGDLFAMDDVPVDIGPTRHAITRGETIYLWDPSGNRNETFSGGYFAYPDRPRVRWTMEHLPRGLDYYRREVKDTFLNAFT